MESQIHDDITTLVATLQGLTTAIVAETRRLGRIARALEIISVNYAATLTVPTVPLAPPVPPDPIGPSA